MFYLSILFHTIGYNTSVLQNFYFTELVTLCHLSVPFMPVSISNYKYPEGKDRTFPVQ